MPIYAYRCESCGHAKDVLQKISDPLLTTCPACGAEQFKKQVTSAGFQLKGSGWYVTDFRGGAAAAPSDASKDGGAASGADKASADKSTATVAAPAASSPSASSSAAAAAPAAAPAAPASK
jgi:putative FmdB family regulatory protein